ncbi:MAG: hypothetical protein JSR45_03735 [Proteobacteria bacterium]|nr:hypothetical protein [Pseudomonadota bacterium]
MSSQWWLLGFGAVCVVAALIGGQLKVGGVEFPVLRPVLVRILLALIGAFLFALAMGLIPSLSQPGYAPASQTGAPASTIAEAPPQSSGAKPQKTCDNQASGNGSIAICDSTVGNVSTNGGSSK